MPAWTHSGFGACVGPRIAERAALLRVARHARRAPVAESRRRDDAERAEVELASDRVDGPFARVHRLGALEFLARGVDHVPDHDEVRVRHAGAYATRRRGVDLPLRVFRAEVRCRPSCGARRRSWHSHVRAVVADAFAAAQ